MAGAETCNLNIDDSARNSLALYGNGAVCVYAACAAAHKNTFILRIEIDELMSGELAAVKSECADKAGFFVCSNKCLNGRMS